MKELVLHIQDSVYLSVTPAKLFGHDSPAGAAEGVSLVVTDSMNGDDVEIYLDKNQVTELRRWLSETFRDEAN